MKKRLFLLIVITLAVPASGVFAEMNVEKIVEKANKTAYYLGEDGRANVSMTIVDSQGRERKRAFTILRLDIKDAGEQKFYVYFTEPSDIEGMVYMVWKHLGRDDDRWMYLPGLDLVRRIAASDKRSSFVGSNFVYEDISGRALSRDKHELTSSQGKQYIIKNTPIDPSGLEFDYFNVYIDKDTFLPVKAEYYKQGKQVRIVEALEIENIQGFPTVTKSKAIDLEAGSSTVIQFSGVKYNIGLEANLFTERYLRRPPRQWLD